VNVTDPIQRVSVVSTGQVQIRPDHLASTWRPTAWWLLASRRWTEPRPINAYVIEHRDGLVLFDTGQDRASVTDPGYFPGGMTGVLYGRLARFEISPQETLTAGLDRLGYAAGDVTTAVISHLHQDHIGGLAELDHADIVVSQAEWDTLSSPLPQLRGLMRSHIDLPGLRWTGSRQSLPATPAWPRSGRVTTCSGTAAWSFCPRPGTRLARCRCWCAGRACRR
jgi:N-acyl homoserine lactone hydrolase